jgi:diadenosine tetraphosphate (Ap4A) HIT family hydrolase
MTNFVLAERLLKESHVLGRLDLCHVLLIDKTEVPWFLLVPETTHTEVCDLVPTIQAAILAEITVLSRFVRTHFVSDKLNVASIGNIVPQMHWHVIGRRRDDPYWPGPVWGQPSQTQYAKSELSRIQTLLKAELAPNFQSVVLES